MVPSPGVPLLCPAAEIRSRYDDCVACDARHLQSKRCPRFKGARPRLPNDLLATLDRLVNSAMFLVDSDPRGD